MTYMCAFVWQLYAPVDRISSNVMMETVSWAADSVTASETAQTDQTKSTAKTVCALCVCVCVYTALQMTFFNYPEGIIRCRRIIVLIFLSFVYLLFLHFTSGCPEV